MIKWIIIGVIGLIILGYLGFDIRKAVESPTTQSNLEYVGKAIKFVWTKFLATPIRYLWNEVFLILIWNRAMDMLKKDEGEVSYMSIVKERLCDMVLIAENRV